MDLLAACRAFVAVSRHGSFTVGAAAARIPQSVASRRIAALETHLGGPLLDRSSRAVNLTPFGADLLPAAQRLVTLADTLEHDAERARRRPLRLAVPAGCPPPLLARLVAAARHHGVHLEVLPAERSGPPHRGAAVVAVSPDAATWRVPVGLACRPGPDTGVLFVETLRPSKGDPGTPPRRIWIQPEDDVPHLRDRLDRLGATVGLRPAQIVLATSLVAAAAEVLTSGDLLLCSAAEASAMELTLRPVGELDLARGYDLATVPRGERNRLLDLLGPHLADCLGASE